MEAIGSVSRSGLACFSAYREALHPLPSAKSIVNTGVSCRLLNSSAGFKDQSHVLFYSNFQYSRKERFTKVMRKASSATAYELHEVRAQDMDESKATLKVKLKKKAKKPKTPASSSSSSSPSSESEAGCGDKRGRGKRDIEQLKREWEAIAQSPLLNSIPTISSEFVIGQPKAFGVTPFSSFGNSCDARQSGGRADMPLALTPVVCTPTANTSSNEVDVSVVNRWRTPTVLDGFTVRRYPSTNVEAQTARVEVCMGGKCRKAGSQQVLSAFEENGVVASACNKCMKNCRAAINVRIVQDDASPQLHSGIRVGDVNALSQKHFGVMSPSSRLSTFGIEPAVIRNEVDSMAN